MDEFFEWWSDQSPFLRYGLALAFIAFAVLHFFLVGRFRYIQAGSLAIGVVLLCFSGPSDPEKKGYRF